MGDNILFFSLLFSIIGMSYFYYGKGINIYFRLAGLALMLYPYFIGTLFWLVVIGILLMLIPFFLTWFYPN